MLPNITLNNPLIMLISLKTVVVPLLLSVTAVDARCYGTGPQWNWSVGRSTAQQHVKNACHGWWNGNKFEKGALQDTYFKPNSESPNPATVCVNAVTNKVGGYHMVMQVTNYQNTGRTLSQKECEDGLISEVNSCEAGGESDKWGWKFRADVEYGWCK
ncbi:hypothetical protein VTL71DRAFT_10494 [Oculimacula yallundae]|uniref:Secreted protein n=1 Tax=Oculimacula yallundae TaxID=86028 RepID=A0ABR4CT98_9HELO